MVGLAGSVISGGGWEMMNWEKPACALAYVLETPPPPPRTSFLSLATTGHVTTRERDSHLSLSPGSSTERQRGLFPWSLAAACSTPHPVHSLRAGLGHLHSALHVTRQVVSNLLTQLNKGNKDSPTCLSYPKRHNGEKKWFKRKILPQV